MNVFVKVLLVGLIITLIGAILICIEGLIPAGVVFITVGSVSMLASPPIADKIGEYKK